MPHQDGTLTGSLDDQLANRLLHQRIIVLGRQVDDACRQPALRAAAAAVRRGPAHRHQPVHQLARAARSRAGLAIYDTMRLIPNDVSHAGDGIRRPAWASSCSRAGTPGKRFALPHARILMHQGSAGIGGTAADIEIQAENLEYTKRAIERLTAEHTGQSDGDDRAGRRPRPLVHRRAGQGVRLVDQILESLADVRPAALDATDGAVT